jgi:hypothetical protein
VHSTAVVLAALTKKALFGGAFAFSLTSTVRTLGRLYLSPPDTRRRNRQASKW